MPTILLTSASGHISIECPIAIGKREKQSLSDALFDAQARCAETGDGTVTYHHAQHPREDDHRSVHTIAEAVAIVRQWCEP